MTNMDFGSFLTSNQAYKSIWHGSSERFDIFFITALDYCHKMDFHLMQQQTEQSEELDSAQQKLSACMNYIRPHVEETYQDEVEAAFDAFKQKHGNDRPILTLPELMRHLDAFLVIVAREIPPQEQNPRGFC